METEVVAWLEQIRKWDQLIDAKTAELMRVRELLVSTVGNLDGMPRGGGTTDKVGELTVKLITLEEELNARIDRYVDRKREIVAAIEKLPAKEYGVIHRYYIRYMTLEEIAQDMAYSVMQISRIKEKGLRLLKDVMEC